MTSNSRLRYFRPLYDSSNYDSQFEQCLEKTDLDRINKSAVNSEQ